MQGERVLIPMKLVWRVLAVAGGLTGMYGSDLALAQSPAPAAVPAAASSDLERQYDAAFQEMLAQPANLDVLFKFATLASQTGDLEGAVSALERMLLINSDLPAALLELGVPFSRLEP